MGSCTDTDIDPTKFPSSCWQEFGFSLDRYLDIFKSKMMVFQMGLKKKSLQMTGLQNHVTVKDTILTPYGC